MGVIFCGVLAWQDWMVYSSGTPDPVDVRLADLTTSGAGGNHHVHVTDLQFGNSYVVDIENDTWRRALIPALAGGQARAIIVTFGAKSEADLVALSQCSQVTGIITNDLHSLGRQEMARLRVSYPGVDFSKLPVVEDGHPFPSRGCVVLAICGTATLAILSAVTGMLWSISTLRARRQAAIGFAAVADVPSERLAGSEGLGDLQRVFLTRVWGRNIIAESTFVIFLFGAFGMCAANHTEPEQMAWMLLVFGSFGALGVVGILLGLITLGDRVELYADGLVCHHWCKTRACRWDEIESVGGFLRVLIASRRGLAVGPLRLRCADGRVVAVGDTSCTPDLANAIYEEVLKRQVPGALTAIGRGATVNVGPLRVSDTGITGPEDSFLE
jgi:hypothetical protein